MEEGISDKAPVEVRLDEVKSLTLTIMQTEVIVYIQISNILEMTHFFLFSFRQQSYEKVIPQDIEMGAY